MKDLKLLLAKWGLEDRDPCVDLSSGAPLAKAVWHLGDDYSLKYGDDPEGLRHHINISKTLKKNGITASCPLQTKTGEDFVLDGQSYYVITERVADNFLVAKVTPPDQYDFYLDRYACEVKKFHEALEKKEPEFMKVLSWASNRAAQVACTFNLPWLDSQASTPEEETFICGTPLDHDCDGLLTRLGGKNYGSALLALLTLFVAWTGTRPDVAPVCKGNIRLANLLHKYLRPING